MVSNNPLHWFCRCQPLLSMKAALAATPSCGCRWKAASGQMWTQISREPAHCLQMPFLSLRVASRWAADDFLLGLRWPGSSLCQETQESSGCAPCWHNLHHRWDIIIAGLSTTQMNRHQSCSLEARMAYRRRTTVVVSRKVDGTFDSIEYHQRRKMTTACQRRGSRLRQ